MDIVTTNEGLAEVCQKIDANGRFGLDLEFIPERTFQPVICLVQISTDNEAFIVDPLTVRNLTPLWERVANPEIQTVLHAAVQDLDLIFRASALIPANIFDTQIAAGFAGFGYPAGYGKLLSQLLGITIAKTESFSDWLERPLTPSQIEYAVEDVCHLLAMADKLKAELRRQGREEWALEECLQYSESSRYIRADKQEFIKVKGANSLNRRGLAVLQSLCELRDQLAAKLDRPIRSVLSDTTLIELSKRPAKQASDIQRIRGIRPDQVRMYSKSLLEATEKALAIPDAECPVWPSAKATPKREVVIGDMLYSVLKVITYEADIATELVATRDEVQTLVKLVREQKALTSDLSLLNGWRHVMAGNTLANLCSSHTLQATFQLDKDPPVVLAVQEKDGLKARDGQLAAD